MNIAAFLISLLGVVGWLGFCVGKLRTLQSRIAMIEAMLHMTVRRQGMHEAAIEQTTGARFPANLVEAARSTVVTSINPLSGVYSMRCPHCRKEHTCSLSRLPTEKDNLS